MKHYTLSLPQPTFPSLTFFFYTISFNVNESSQFFPSTLKYSRARDKKLYVIVSVYTFILFSFFNLTFLSLFFE